MPMMTGGSFAPPLSDSLLLRAKELISALPARTKLREILDILYNAVEQWWEKPESNGSNGKSAHPSGRGTIVKLDTETERDLWTHLPWDEDLEGYKELVEGIQSDASRRNGETLTAWRAAVRDALIAESFTPEEIAWLRSPQRKMLRVVMAKMGEFDANVCEPCIDAIIAAIGVGQTRETLEDHAKRMRAVEAELHEINNERVTPPIPRPTLENTELRDLAKNLLWHVVELNANREPITKDKL